MRSVCLMVLFSIVFMSCLAAEPVPIERQTTNIAAFGRLFGLVRYFYPGDEGREVIWNKMAIHGVHHVANAASDRELAIALQEVLAPVAPTLELYSPKGSFPKLPGTARPPMDIGMNRTFWQYDGLPTMMNSVYQKCRANRPFEIRVSQSNSDPIGFVCPILPELDNKAKALRVSFSCIATASDTTVTEYDITYDQDSAKGSLSMDIWQQIEHSFENMQALPDINISFSGFEQVLVDLIKVEQLLGDTWQTVYFNDFETSIPGQLPKQLDVNCSRYNTFVASNVDVLCAQNGSNRVLSMSPAQQSATNTLGFMHHLFDAEPDYDDVVDEALNANIRCRFPLVLPCDDEHTYPQSSPTAFQELVTALSSIDVAKRDDPLAWTAGVVAYWNDLKLFFPYWQFTPVDWDGELESFVRQALQAKSFDDYKRCIRSMASRTLDGHSVVIDPYEPQFMPGFEVDLIENKWIVNRVFDPNLQIVPGSEVLQMNGSDFYGLMNEQKPLFTMGTEAYTYKRLFTFYIRTLTDTLLTFTLRTPKGQETTVQTPMQDYPQVYDSISSAKVIRYTDKVFYLNACSLSDAEWQELLPELATAKGIIFDFRDYPSIGTSLISHLITEPNTARFSHDLHYIYPGKPLESKRYSPYPEWMLSPQEPYLNAMKVFLTGAGGISYTETYLQMLRANKAGIFIGQSTAGTTGNINITQMTGNLYAYWTGMYILNPDGTRFHGIGVVPDIYVQPTIQALVDGFDQELATALEYIAVENLWAFIPEEIERSPKR